LTNTTSIETSTRARRLVRTAADNVRELAEAGAQGHVLTAAEVRAVCEALRAQGSRARNQFHSGV